MKRIGGSRRKKLGIFSKDYRRKGKISLTRYLKEFNEGDKVILHIEPGEQKGLFLPRFQGKKGTIIKRQGNAYHVKITDGNKEKVIITRAIHLKQA